MGDGGVAGAGPRRGRPAAIGRLTLRRRRVVAMVGAARGAARRSWRDRTGPARYCPQRPVTRAEMATFLSRAFRLSPAPPAGFTDTVRSVHRSAIDALAGAGITAGCTRSPARYCPSVAVTRAQMASFLYGALRFNATVTWLSAGDSYSSGVGTDPHAEGPCRRSPQAAGPAAAEMLRLQGWTIAHTHTACEGGLVEDMFNRRSQASGRMSMWEEHVEALGGPRRVDVVTLSLGGNDVGFEEVVLACVPFTRVTELFVGCPSEAALQARIDSLVDPSRTCPGTSRRASRPDYGCALRIDGQQYGSISDFYREIVTERLTERGRLYVIGYPEPDRPLQRMAAVRPVPGAVQARDRRPARPAGRAPQPAAGRRRFGRPTRHSAPSGSTTWTPTRRSVRAVARCAGGAPTSYTA